MKGFAEFLGFILVLVLWVSIDFIQRNSANLLFTAGLTSITIGCALLDASAAFIVPGVVVCGLLILGRLLPVYTSKGGGHA